MDTGEVDACVRFYSLPGDTVIDPFAGSGTVAKVAAPLGRVPLLIEREPAFVAGIRQTVSLEWRALETLPRPLSRAGVQLALPLHAAAALARKAYLATTTSELVSTRVREMAARATALCGIDIPPELVSVFLRAERQYYAARTS